MLFKIKYHSSMSNTLLVSLLKNLFHLRTSIFANEANICLMHNCNAFSMLHSSIILFAARDMNLDEEIFPRNS